MDNYRSYLPRVIVSELKADPIAWLLRARSPLVKWATMTQILEWSHNHPDVQTYRSLIHEDNDLQCILNTQNDNGLWSSDNRLYQNSLVGAYYKGTVWQLPILADLQVKAGNNAADKPFELIIKTRTPDGYFNLTGNGTEFIWANAITIAAFLDMGFRRTELESVISWLVSKQRDDGGWADFFELKTPDAPSSIKTTAAVLYAIRSSNPNISNQALVSGKRGAAYLLNNFGGDYMARFPNSTKAWNKLSYPQYNFDCLSVGIALQLNGISKNDLAPVTEAIRELQNRRGFWRQKVNIIAPIHIQPVSTSRGSRWLSFKATKYFKRLFLKTNEPLSSLYS